MSTVLLKYYLLKRERDTHKLTLYHTHPHTHTLMKCLNLGLAAFFSLSQAALLSICPDLTEAQQLRLVSMFQDPSGLISYTAFLARFVGQPPVYRRGNNLGHLLAQKPLVYGDPLISTKPPELVHTSPTYGLPGVKAALQKQVRTIEIRSC